MKVFETEQEAATYCKESILKIVANKPSALLCLAAGHTSLSLFKQLVASGRSEKIDFSKIKIVGLDEWVGLSGREDGSCENFLRENLFDHINIKEKNIRLFNGKADDLQAEYTNVETFIRENDGIDYMLLGVGMNGHLGLNEPGTNVNRSAHVTNIDSVTKTVANKYFKQKPNLTAGITLGIKNILDAKVVQVLITGERKREITKKIVDLDETNAVPATLIKNRRNVEFVVDNKAAQIL